MRQIRRRHGFLRSASNSSSNIAPSSNTRMLKLIESESEVLFISAAAHFAQLVGPNHAPWGLPNRYLYSLQNGTMPNILALSEDELEGPEGTMSRKSFKIADSLDPSESVDVVI